MEQSNIIAFPPERVTLTPEQEQHWYEQLEIAQRKVEYAQRMLGLLATEAGLDG